MFSAGTQHAAGNNTPSWARQNFCAAAGSIVEERGGLTGRWSEQAGGQNSYAGRVPVQVIRASGCLPLPTNGGVHCSHHFLHSVAGLWPNPIAWDEGDLLWLGIVDVGHIGHQAPCLRFSKVALLECARESGGSGQHLQGCAKQHVQPFGQMSR